MSHINTVFTLCLISSLRKKKNHTGQLFLPVFYTIYQWFRCEWPVCAVNQTKTASLNRDWGCLRCRGVEVWIDGIKRSREMRHGFVWMCVSFLSSVLPLLCPHLCSFIHKSHQHGEIWMASSQTRGHTHTRAAWVRPLVLHNQWIFSVSLSHLGQHLSQQLGWNTHTHRLFHWSHFFIYLCSLVENKSPDWHAWDN